MILKTFEPAMQLQPFVDSIWVYESDCGILPEKGGLIVPNGKPRIILPYKNSLYTNKPDGNRLLQENEINFVGVWDEPMIIHTPPGLSALIIMQLTPKGGYRFTDFPMSELTNRLAGFDKLYGRQGGDFQDEVARLEDVCEKVELLQQFLISKLFSFRKEQPIVSYVIDAITRANGLIEIKRLAKKTGYSVRYLDFLFQQYIGFSPKTLACITRFQKFYHLFANNCSPDFYKDDLHAFYYDQSHFIKEFKKYTGHTPEKYAEVSNEFGRLFYRTQPARVQVQDQD